MTKAVVLDLDQGDVLMFKADMEHWSPETFHDISDELKEALGVEVFFVDKSIDVDLIGKDSVERIAKLWADPKMRSALRTVADLIKDAELDLKPKKATGRRFACAVIISASEYCGKVLDSNYECPIHGHDVPYQAVNSKGEWM